MSVTRASLATPLAFLLTEKQVPDTLQDLLAKEGILTLTQFAEMEDSKADVHKMVKED